VNNRSQWPHGLRHELPPPAQTLGYWVRIPHGTWMSVCVNSVFVLSFVQVATLRQADPPSKEFYRLHKKIKKLKRGRGPTKSCKATEKEKWEIYGTSPGESPLLGFFSGFEPCNTSTAIFIMLLHILYFVPYFVKYQNIWTTIANENVRYCDVSTHCCATHTANNTWAMLSVVRAQSVVIQREHSLHVRGDVTQQ
jgi:hypothetical protein